jgi:hypothetical protein
VNDHTSQRLLTHCLGARAASSGFEDGSRIHHKTTFTTLQVLSFPLAKSKLVLDNLRDPLPAQVNCLFHSKSNNVKSSDLDLHIFCYHSPFLKSAAALLTLLISTAAMVS